VVERRLSARLPQFWQVRGIGMVEVSRRNGDRASVFDEAIAAPATGAKAQAALRRGSGSAAAPGVCVARALRESCIT
jgi:hypothetical protein